MIRQFISFDEAATMLESDSEGLRQAFELGLSRDLPAYVYAGSQPFLARLEGRGVKVVATNIHDASSGKVDVPGFGPLSHFDLWDEQRMGDALGEVQSCSLPQSTTGHPFTLELRGYFRVDTHELKSAARERYLGMAAVAPASWWGAECEVPKHPNGTPTVMFRLLPTNNNGYLDMPALRDLKFKIFDVEALKVSRSASFGNEDSKPLDARERATLLAIIGALADEAKLDLSQHYKAGQALAARLQGSGVKLSPRTIGDHLKAVREAMDSRKG